MKFLNVRQFFFLSALILFACQEDQLIDEPELNDEDMTHATLLAEEYLKSENGRFSNSDKAITVLKYKDGKLLFDTNTDDYSGYQEVVETSVTAIVEPGDYIFWFAGGGLSEVDSIDFDEEAELILGDLPLDFVPTKMWVVRVPANISSNTDLKYDIVYLPRGTDIKVRLDPKIGVMGAGDSSEGENTGGD